MLEYWFFIKLVAITIKNILLRLLQKNWTVSCWPLYRYHILYSYSMKIKPKIGKNI